jgi:hypothetical protein
MNRVDRDPGFSPKGSRRIATSALALGLLVAGCTNSSESSVVPNGTTAVSAGDQSRSGNVHEAAATGEQARRDSQQISAKILDQFKQAAQENDLTKTVEQQQDVQANTTTVTVTRQLSPDRRYIAQATFANDGPNGAYNPDHPVSVGVFNQPLVPGSEDSATQSFSIYLDLQKGTSEEESARVVTIQLGEAVASYYTTNFDLVTENDLMQPLTPDILETVLTQSFAILDEMR